MNQQNSRIHLIVTVVLLFSAKSYSLQKTETNTSMIHTSWSTENETDTFAPLSTAGSRDDSRTNNSLTSQPSKKVSPTISSATKILEDIHKGNITNTNTKPYEHLWRRTENSTYALISSISAENTVQTISDNNKLIVIILLPILTLFLLGLVIAILLNCSRGKRQRINDDVNCESPASPIFEEDVASVMEVEMDEVNRWMGSLKETTRSESLPDVSEDKN